MKKSILLPGGAGYVGSHAAYLLAQQGYHVIVLDTFLHGQKVNMPWATIIKKDFADQVILDHIFTTYDVVAVMHFAAFIEVGKSVKKPQEFYENNVTKVFTLLNNMLKHNVKQFIFSSSCAVYGDPIKIPMNETHPKDPVSPYGKNKLVVEYALQDYAQAYDVNYVSLRYFNAAGAWPEQRLGEQHKPETHIIPLLLKALQESKPFYIFGNDYETKDGSCLRDYIHVRDIAQAHVLALDYLQRGGQSDAFNLGTGSGYTVREMVEAAEKITGKRAQLINAPRRVGDATALVADPTKIKRVLGWQSKYSDLESILSSAYTWHYPFQEVMCKEFSL